MAQITIYTTQTCPYCIRAKGILKNLAMPFTEIDVTADDEKRRWLVGATGRRTVPQIFVDDKPIGGCDDLESLVASGGFQAAVKT